MGQYRHSPILSIVNGLISDGIALGSDPIVSTDNSLALLLRDAGIVTPELKTLNGIGYIMIPMWMLRAAKEFLEASDNYADMELGEYLCRLIGDEN
jgi:hypothetical protein